LAFAAALCALTAGVAGCNSPGLMNSWLNSFLNPSEVGSYGPLGRETTLDIRTSLTLEDAPSEIAGVTEPQPEDLVPIVTEYEYGIGDSVIVRVFELLQRGTETAAQVVVDETGSITLPAVGRIEVIGLTLREIQAAIVDEIVRQGLLVDPEVIVDPGVRRKLSYSIYGVIAQPSLYPLGSYDFRLLEAVNMAGGLLDSVTEIFVVRGEELPEPVFVSRRDDVGGSPLTGARAHASLSDGYTAGGGAGRRVAAAQPRWGQPLVAQPPPATGAADPAASQPISTQGEAPPQWKYINGEWMEVAPPVRSQPAEPRATPAGDEPTQQEIFDTMDTRPAPAEPAASAPDTPVTAAPSQPRWIYKNGKWIETEAPVASAPEAPEVGTQPSIDWAQVAGMQEHRVIRVLAHALREGDPRYNIIIRPGDVIRLAAGQFGEYYLMGQVARPGAYSLTGRQITLKTAIAAGGNLGPLAWPENCTVYRRIGDREQMIQVNLDAIFAGRDQDFYLKRDDLILVGTHPVARFLAVLRNAFRVSYGFGFVYDRNFADIDSYNAKFNPENVQTGVRFPNLFR
jgi:protein involved in polysaccharide export with SLBB domain